MLSKHDQHRNNYENCLAKADISSGRQRLVWLTLADSYRLLLFLEQVFPDGREAEWPKVPNRFDGDQM